MTNQPPKDELKIYGSTDYIENKKIGDLKLGVVSQWDFKSKAVAWSQVTSIGGDKIVISYTLQKTVRVDEDGRGWRTEPVKELTKEMRKKLESMGYEVSDE